MPSRVSLFSILIKFVGLDYQKRLNLGDLEDSADRLNALYGGLSPKGTQVVYTIGELDPWHTLGNHQGTPESPVIVIQGMAIMSSTIHME
jgi:hypothetical protein